MILHMKFAPPLIGTITVKTPFFMVSEEKKEYRIMYKTQNGYRGIYNVSSFEVLQDGKT